jgi:hypothetical protein
MVGRCAWRRLPHLHERYYVNRFVLRAIPSWSPALALILMASRSLTLWPPDVPHLQKRETSLPGVWVIQPDILRDARGFFMETYHQAKFAGLGIAESFLQDNHS